MIIFVQEASSDDSKGKRPRGAVIREKRALFESLVAGLVRHLLAAGREREEQEWPKEQSRRDISNQPEEI
jgi:hypothetical protein